MFTIGHWQPKIGDPTIIGWFTVFSYYLCAVLSLAGVWKLLPQTNGDKARMDRRFQMGMTTVVIFLGLSKHFNLPGAVTEIGRFLAKAIGGYESRRWPQAVLLLLIGFVLAWLVRWSVHHPRFRVVWQHRAPEIIGLGYLCGLFVLRAVSLHQMGALLAIEVFGLRLNWLVELSGIYALIAIVLFRLRMRTEREAV